MYVYGINQSHPITLLYKTIPCKPDQTRPETKPTKRHPSHRVIQNGQTPVLEENKNKTRWISQKQSKAKQSKQLY